MASESQPSNIDIVRHLEAGNSTTSIRDVPCFVGQIESARLVLADEGSISLFREIVSMC